MFVLEKLSLLANNLLYNVFSLVSEVALSISDNSSSEQVEEVAKKTLPHLKMELLPSQLFWLAICFIFVYLMMSKILLPRINDTIRWRNKIIEDNLLSAETLIKNSDANKDNSSILILSAREKADAIVKEIVLDIEGKLKNAMSKVDIDIEERQKETQAWLEENRKNFDSNVEKISIDVADFIVEKIISSDIKRDSLPSIVSNKIREAKNV